MRCNYGAYGPVNGINKDICGAKLLLTTISAYPVDYVCFCDLLKALHCLSSNERYNLPPAGHPHHHPPHAPPTCSPLIHTTYDITVAVKEVTINPAVSTS